VPVSLAAQLEIELTMRTTPVVELTHAETELDTGAAMAAIPVRSEKISTPPHLRNIISLFILGNFLITSRNTGKFMLFSPLPT
jgi:hypothetical protein